MKRTASIALLAALILSMALTPFAYAADPTAPAPAGSAASLSTSGDPQPPSAGSTSITAAQIAANPYGCFGRSDRPHLSTHVPGSVAAEGSTICSYFMPRVYVRATLFKQECVLFVCWWTQVDQRVTEANWVKSVSAVPWKWCEGTSPGRKYRITSYHEATGADGVTYYASTASESATLACN